MRSRMEDLPTYADMLRAHRRAVGAYFAAAFLFTLLVVLVEVFGSAFLVGWFLPALGARLLVGWRRWLVWGALNFLALISFASAWGCYEARYEA